MKLVAINDNILNPPSVYFFNITRLFHKCFMLNNSILAVNVGTTMFCVSRFNKGEAVEPIPLLKYMLSFQF
nr:MAG TPA: hypothetical protein [Bacteriophage sp.]